MARCKEVHSTGVRCGRDEGHPPPHRPATRYHVCHAYKCNKQVPPRMLMCLRHWRMVPRVLQRRVWETYVEGQEERMDPTSDYMQAQKAAVDAVAKREGLL